MAEFGPERQQTVIACKMEMYRCLSKERMGDGEVIMMKYLTVWMDFKTLMIGLNIKFKTS